MSRTSDNYLNKIFILLMKRTKNIVNLLDNALKSYRVKRVMALTVGNVRNGLINYSYKFYSNFTKFLPNIFILI